MGLDMYLKAEKYLSNYDFRPEEKVTNNAVKAAVGLDEYDSVDSSVTVSVTVGYWRKANQIHKWFVDNCQDGVDECQDAYVSRDNLIELLEICNKALETKDASLLPPASGFFFGSTDIDEWYWQDLEQTKFILNKALSLDESWDFNYRSSW